MEAAKRKESSQELLTNKIRLMKKFTCNILEHELKWNKRIKETVLAFQESGLAFYFVNYKQFSLRNW